MTKRLNRFRPQLSVSCITVFIVLVSVAVAASCAVGISYAFSLSGVSSIAILAAQNLALKTRDNVQNFLSAPLTDTESIQFLCEMNNISQLSAAHNSPDWYMLWWRLFIPFMFRTGFHYQFVSLGFEDGNFVGCTNIKASDYFQCTFVSWGDRSEDDPNGFSTVNSVTYSRTTGAIYGEPFEGLTLFDPRGTRWYNQVQRERGAKAMSSVDLSSDAGGTVPVIDATGAIYDNNGTFSGVAMFMYELDKIDAQLKSARPSLNAHVILLDQNLFVVGSSLPVSAYSNYTVSDNYTLSQSELADHCVISSATTPIYVICPLYIKEFPYKPLVRFHEENEELFDSGAVVSVSTVSVGGEKYFGTLASVPLIDAQSVKWHVAVLFPESEVMSRVDNGRNIAIGVTAAIIVIVAVVVGVTLKVLLRPLAVVADRMGSAAYLRVKGGGTSAQSNTIASTPDLLAKAERAQRALLTERSTSYLSDVASIQQAYWEMADELWALKGYIPEYICNEAIRRAPAARSPMKGKVHSDQSPRFSPEAHGGSVDPDFSPDNSPDAIELKGKSDIDAMSLDDVSVAALRAARGTTVGFDSPIFYRDNGLVERDVSVVVVNIVAFHQYVAYTNGKDISRDHEVVVSFIRKVAQKYDGVLDTFNGDKFWVSFNAIAKCSEGPIAALCFAHEVTTAINTDAIATIRQLHSGRPPLANAAPKYKVAPNGVNCGVSTGRALVGPLGTDTVRRHSIISFAVSEASALERQSLRYPGCNVMIGGDMIPAAEGYFQYMLLDASALPGSGGMRRRVASVKGPMCAPGCNPDFLRRVPRTGLSLPKKNPYAGINSCFNAFLEGRMDDVTRSLAQVENKCSQACSRGRGLEGQLSPEQVAEIRVMISFLHSFTTSSEQIDGRMYSSPLGDIYQPIAHVISLDDGLAEGSHA